MGHPIVERLASPRAEERARACREAPEDPAAVVLVDALVEALGDAERSVASAAVEALVAIGREHDVSAALRRGLRAPGALARFHAAWAHARLEPPGPALLPALVGVLGNEARELRWRAARLLVETGRLHPEVATLVGGLVRTGEPLRLRCMACHCLRELAPDDPGAAAALLEASRAVQPPLRRAALTALAGLLAPPAAVEARLQEAARDEADEASRELARSALAQRSRPRPGPA